MSTPIKLSCRELAETFLLDNYIGQPTVWTYATERDVCNAPMERRIVGLLEIIATELRKQPPSTNERQSRQLDKHREWLNCYKPYIDRLARIRDKYLRTIGCFADLKVLGIEARAVRHEFFRWTIMSNDPSRFWKSYYCEQSRNDRLAKVRCGDDLTLLHRVGKKTATKARKDLD